MSKLSAFIVLVALSPSVSSAKPVDASNNPIKVAQIKSRLSHARELLGSTYKKSVVRKSEKIKDISSFVEATTKKFLPAKSKNVSKKLAKAILKHAREYNLDPVFLMAVIQNESSFKPAMRGGAGEIGLMQVKPSTAKWIAKIYNIPYKGDKSLLDPAMNVRIGAALMDKLRHQFDSKSRLYVSAYNIGATKVRSLVEGKHIPKDYVQAVMKRYIAIYSAFREEGNPTERSEIAWNHTLDLTRRIATVKVDPVLETMAIETRFDPERIVEAEVQIN